MSKFALLLAAGLLINVSIISAQETETSEPQVSSEEQQGEVRNPYAGEQELLLGSTGGGNDGAAGQSNNTQTIWSVIRMVLVLILVAVAIYGIVFLLKKSSKKTPNKDPFLKILANAHLGSNRYVHVVSVGNKTWLLGASDGGVSCIGEIDDKDVIDAMLLEESKNTAQSPGKLPDFTAILRRLGAPAKPASSGADEIRKRRERIGGL